MTNDAVKLLAQCLLANNYNDIPQRERKVIERIARKVAIAADAVADHEQAMTFGERLADRVARFGGSWTFMLIFAFLLLFWVALNSVMLTSAFDPYPYILLNLFLSMLASIQAPIIMMSQNRQAAKDRLDASLDYEINLKAEIEIMALHEKLDSMRNTELLELLKHLRK
jgi:uncharacterized membrane protein